MYHWSESTSAGEETDNQTHAGIPFNFSVATWSVFQSVH